MPNQIDLPRLQGSQTADINSGIVHLGLGAFFRAHGAVYISQAIKASGGDWGIIGASLVRPFQRDLLAPQGFAYTTVEKGPDGDKIDVVNILSDVLVARENPAQLIETMADPRIRIVTMTISEKGYCHEPSTGKLNAAHPDIQADIENPDAPRSAIGFIVRALQVRKSKGDKPFTVLCCDNLPNNGDVVRGVVLDLAALIDPPLATWIAENGAFPSTMVDRIVPATKDEDIAQLAETTGVLDLSPVFHEPFRQWVIEDNFVDGERPDFGAVGVQLVDDVEPYENMKLRCLNGSHSALAYLGYLAGHETIFDAVTDPVLGSFVKNLWKDEIIPSLEPPQGQDLQEYADALQMRFSNPAIRHLTWQIAMDGSQKLPQRLLGTISDNLEAGLPIHRLSLAVAAWMRYVGGVDEKGGDIDVRDPMAAQLREICDGATSSESLVQSLLAVEEVFPSALSANQTFKQAVVEAYELLATKGAAAAARSIDTQTD